jgi:hypothetical protein
MPWTPLISPTFMLALRPNLLRVLKRDMPAAFAYFGGVGEPFERYALCELVEEKARSRCLALGVGTAITPRPDPNGVSLEHSVTVLVAVTGSDPDQLTLELDRRVAAADSVLRESKWVDLFEGLNVGAGGRVFDVVAHAYSVQARRSNEWMYSHECELAVRIRYLEK